MSPATAGAPSPATSPDSAPEIPLYLEQAELWNIKRAIARSSGNIFEAASLLGTSRNRIYRALAQDERPRSPLALVSARLPLLEFMMKPSADEAVANSMQG